jgi:UPF0755 protein
MSDLGIGMQPQPAQRPPSGGRRSQAAISISVIAVVVILAAGLLVGRWALGAIRDSAPPDYPGPGSGSVTVTVNPGDSVTTIGTTLAEADVVASAEAFVRATDGDSRANTIAPGSYVMLLQMSAAGAFERLLDPAARDEVALALPEGLRIDQVVERTSAATGIPAAELQQVLRDPSAGLQLPQWNTQSGELRAEGQLFPATYQLPSSATALEVLQRFVDRFNESAEKVGIAGAQEAVGVTPYEALIVASLVQAEGIPEDFPKVARVIYNRLDEQTWGETYWFLQLDATLNYALQTSSLNLTDAQRETDTPYNTYKYPGLPPTPINSPGDAAMAAALAPEPGDWLYYVTVNPDTGETRFTADYQEFLGYKAEFQAWCAANRDRC